MNKKLTKYALAGAVGVQLLIIFCCNYFKSVDMLDYDSGMAVRHAVEMWKSGTVFLENFGYTTSMEIDCAAFLAAPIYLLTGNYGLGMGIAHLLLDTILAYLIYQILKNMNVAYEFRMLGILLVFLPYKYGQLDWNNMIFLAVGQYEFRVISALFLFMLLSYNKKWNKWSWVSYGVGQVFIFVTVLSTGNYFIITVLVPLLLYEIFCILRAEKLGWKDRNLNIVIWSMGTALLAYGINKGMHIAIGRSNMNILKDMEFADNILGCFAGIVALFGGLPGWDVSIISAKGMAYLVRFVFTCIILSFIVIAFIRRRDIRENKTFLKRFFFLFLTNIFVLCYANTLYGARVFETRYHIVWCVLLIVADVMLFSIMWKSLGDWMKKAVISCIFLGVVIINVSGFGAIWEVTNLDEPIITRSIEIAEEYGIHDIIVVDGVVARKMSAMHIDKNVKFGEVDQNSGAIEFSTWGTYFDTSVAASNLILVREGDLPRIPPEITGQYQEIPGQDGWKILITGSYAW